MPSESSTNRPRSRRRRSSAGRGATRSRDEIEPLHPTATPPAIESFREWDLGPPIQAAIAAMNIVRPTPIQALAIGPVLAGRDVIAKAETGTGKTLAFGAPMIARIDPARRTVLGLVLAPTRELSEQVHGVLEVLGATRGVRTALIVGGEPMGPQVAALQAGVQVVVGTPGRVLDLMRQGFLTFPWTEYVVLDEADKMLEIGFIDDVRAILAAVNDERQTLLFSATFPTPLLRLARESTRDPVEVATSLGVSTVETIAQFHLEVPDDDASRALLRLMDYSAADDVFLVFCDRRTDVDRLLRRIERGRHPIKALHGGYDQASRFRVMSAFRTGEVKCLIATDVASRGLDVEHVTHVINYGVPRDPSDYTHRIGRTGRAGRAGTALTLVTPVNRRRWRTLAAALPFAIQTIESPRELFTARRAPAAMAVVPAPAPVAPATERVNDRRPQRPRPAATDAPQVESARRGTPEPVRNAEPRRARATHNPPATRAVQEEPRGEVALALRPGRDREPAAPAERVRDRGEPAHTAAESFGMGILDTPTPSRAARSRSEGRRAQAPEEPSSASLPDTAVGAPTFGAGL